MRNAAFFLLAIVLTAATAARAAEAPPSVLFIAVDDLNDWVGHLGGHPDVRTPNLDRLARRGVSFTNAHCAAPACNPSRAALMSGLRPSQTGIYHNPDDTVTALGPVTTLTEHFRAHGYRAVGGGKIFHGGRGMGRYWDDYYQPATQSPEARRLLSPRTPYNGLGRGHFDWKAVDLADEEMPDYQLASWAVEQIRQPGDRPLFLAVGFVKPHLPWFVPKKYFDLYPKDRIAIPEVPDDDLADVPPIGLKMASPEGDHRAVVEAGQWRDAVQAYLATISFLDAQVGRVLDALDASPMASRTVIVLWGDHGWHLGEKQHWRKFALWEEATRAPLVWVAPGVTGEGKLSSQPVDFLSIYPTLCDLCGLPVPEHVRGPSLRPLLENPEAGWEHVALTTHGRGEHAVRSGQWRYIRYHDGTEELYDHAADPMEWKNLAGDPACTKLKRELGRVLPTEEAPELRRPKGKAGGGEAE